MTGQPFDSLVVKAYHGLFCYLLGGFRALKISSFGQLYCGHHKAWWRESRDWLLHQDVYSLSTAFLMAVMMMVWIQSHAKELLVHSPNHEKIPSEERELDVKPIMSSFASMNSKFFFTVDEILEWEHLLCAWFCNFHPLYINQNVRLEFSIWAFSINFCPF